MNRCARCQRPVRYKYCPACCKVLGINYNDLWRRRQATCRHCGASFKYNQSKPQTVCQACRALKRWRVINKISGAFWRAFYDLYEHGQRKGTLQKAIEQMDEMLMDK